MPKLIKLSIIFLAILLAVFIVTSALAVVEYDDEGTGEGEARPTGLVPVSVGGCPDGYTGNCGNYQLNDFLRIGIIVSNFILGIVGALALLAFVAGGLMWLLSAGKSELVEKGKQTIIGATVGLAIVFTSFMIIQLVFTALDIKGTDKGQWATSGWTSIWLKSQ